MKIRKNSKPEKCIATEPFRHHINNAFLDVDKSRLVATNGHMLACVPVEIEEGDATGFVSSDALKQARKGLKTRDTLATIACNGSLRTQGVTFERPPWRAAIEYEPAKLEDGSANPKAHETKPGVPFPPYEQVMVEYSATDPDVVRVGLNAKYLLELAQALGANPAFPGVELRIKREKDGSASLSPVQVLLYGKGESYPDEDNPAVGTIMPMRV
jgi:hypothetical protein